MRTKDKLVELIGKIQNEEDLKRLYNLAQHLYISTTEEPEWQQDLSGQCKDEIYRMIARSSSEEILKRIYTVAYLNQ